MTGKLWEAAPLAPFVVLRASWQLTEAPGGSGLGLEMPSLSWMGWMARPPEDWSKARASWHLLSGSTPWGEEKFSVFARQTKGVGAPLLSSEGIDDADPGGERVVMARFVTTIQSPPEAQVPREWDQNWHDAWSESLLWGREALFEEVLRDMGFSSLMPLGRHFNLSGCDYWLNAAQAVRPCWAAMDCALSEKREFEAALTVGPAESKRTL